MKITKKLIYVMAAILWLICLVLVPLQMIYFVLNPLGSDDDRNHVEVPSPDKNIIVDTLNAYGGATSADVTQILIRRQSEEFDSRKNFILFSIAGIQKTKIKWVNNAQLEIQYHPGVVYYAATKWNGITVIYSELK